MATPYNPLDRNASLHEVSVAWALRYHYLDKVLRTLKIRPDRGEEVVRTLNDPVGTPFEDVKEGAMFCAAVLGIIARRYEGDEPGYASLVQNFSQQPLGMLRGELIGHLFGLGALLEAALTVHREREDQASVEVLALERTLTQVLGQIKRWANDALPWLGQRVRPLAPEPPAGEETAP